MLNPASLKARFATPLHFAPTAHPPTLTQVLAALGLISLGVGIGVFLAPVLKQWNAERRPLPRRSAPIGELDRWANEGGAVLPPAFPVERKGP